MNKKTFYTTILFFFLFLAVCITFSIVIEKSYNQGMKDQRGIMLEGFEQYKIKYCK